MMLQINLGKPWIHIRFLHKYIMLEALYVKVLSNIE